LLAFEQTGQFRFILIGSQSNVLIRLGADEWIVLLLRMFRATSRPVQFEISEQSRNSVEAWLPILRTTGARFLFPSRLRASPHISTRQYARMVHRWVESIGLETVLYGTHSMRRTRASQIYRKTGNLRAVQLLLGHTKLESTVRYLGIEVDDALNMAEQIEL
jgi:integrase